MDKMPKNLYRPYRAPEIIRRSVQGLKLLAKHVSLVRG